MSEEQDRQLAYRVRILPEQLSRARMRVRQLEIEADRLGMSDLLTDPATINNAWEREMELAKIGDVSPAPIEKSAA